jgi:hypothetical protein
MAKLIGDGGMTDGRNQTVRRKIMDGLRPQPGGHAPPGSFSFRAALPDPVLGAPCIPAFDGDRRDLL